MAGNELETAKFLFENIDNVELEHLGVVKTLGVPIGDSIVDIKVASDLKLLKTQDAKKKADLFINGVGISLKQSGGCFLFNRVQRASIENVFKFAGLGDADSRLEALDQAVDNYHKGLLTTRCQPWQIFFNESDFKLFLEYLMMKGSPIHGVSNHQAEYILESPKNNISESNIITSKFDEFFEANKHSLYISIRPQWIGQISKSEHSRAVGIAKKPGNYEWVYDNVVGSPLPRNGKIWRDEIDVSDRKTVYMIYVEKK